MIYEIVAIFNFCLRPVQSLKNLKARNCAKQIDSKSLISTESQIIKRSRLRSWEDSLTKDKASRLVRYTKCLKFLHETAASFMLDQFFPMQKGVITE